jgi:hypothetical protein
VAGIAGSHGGGMVVETKISPVIVGDIHSFIEGRDILGGGLDSSLDDWRVGSPQRIQKLSHAGTRADFSGDSDGQCFSFRARKVPFLDFGAGAFTVISCTGTRRTGH